MDELSGFPLFVWRDSGVQDCSAHAFLWFSGFGLSILFFYDNGFRIGSELELARK